jgi:hypothetical protein
MLEYKFRALMTIEALFVNNSTHSDPLMFSEAFAPSKSKCAKAVETSFFELLEIAGVPAPKTLFTTGRRPV